MRFLASLRLKPSRLFAFGAGLVLASLTACVAPPPAAPPPPPPAPVVVLPPEPVAGHKMDHDDASFLRPPNLAAGQIPVRVGVILPFGSATTATRNLAAAMMKAASLAVYDSKENNIVLMTADEGARPADAAAAATKLLGQGAEVIIGPLLGPDVAAVTPIARDRGVPVLAFSTEKSVAGNGAYLLSFLPQDAVKRVLAYAASKGHHNFAAMVPQGDYGTVVEGAYSDAVKATGGTSVDVEHFMPNTSAVMAPSVTIAKSNADAVLIAQGGPILRAIAPSLSFNGLDPSKVKLLGTGEWNDPTDGREQTLVGGWFAAPAPEADDVFNAKYKDAYGVAPPSTFAGLAYDAVSLVALLAPGPAYHRFTQAALMDPNGFAGVDGIFRFKTDGTSERGLAVLEVTPEGFGVADPAPKTFQAEPAL